MSTFRLMYHQGRLDIVGDSRDLLQTMETFVEILLPIELGDGDGTRRAWHEVSGVVLDTNMSTLFIAEYIHGFCCTDW